MEKEFFNEIRERNKQKFIALRTKQLEKDHAKENGVFIPEFLDAETEYNQFKEAGCFDEYGYLKQIEVA